MPPNSHCASEIQHSITQPNKTPSPTKMANKPPSPPSLRQFASAIFAASCQYASRHRAQQHLSLTRIASSSPSPEQLRYPETAKTTRSYLHHQKKPHGKPFFSSPPLLARSILTLTRFNRFSALYTPVQLPQHLLPHTRLSERFSPHSHCKNASHQHHWRF